MPTPGDDLDKRVDAKAEEGDGLVVHAESDRDETRRDVVEDSYRSEEVRPLEQPFSGFGNGPTSFRRLCSAHPRSNQASICGYQSESWDYYSRRNLACGAKRSAHRIHADHGASPHSAALR